ncbi:M24 family metallopeptidase [Paenibacillus sp. TAB 01]|uniref:M24 family metallopeptidase n=1 Tax=Paenibacillus sp. TAB 01 TaxID=3368988 RepID=UPI003753D5A2
MSEINSRIEKLQERLRQQQAEGCLITQNVDLYYFTGSMQTGYLFVPVEGEARFFVRRSVVRAESESAVPVEALGSFRDFCRRLAQLYPSIFLTAGADRKLRIAAEFDVLPVQQLHRLQAVLPDMEWLDGSLIIRELRMIKSAAEIAFIREAARVIDFAFETAMQTLRPGMTELELMSGIEHTIRREGHIGTMRMRGYNQEVITGMIGAGEAAAVPSYFDGPAGGQGLSAAVPQSVSRRPIRQGEPILIDIGCCIEGYVIDQTRTVSLGAPDEDLLQAYHVTEAILRSVETELKPGTVCEHLYRKSLMMADEAGLSGHFMGFGADQVKFLGHGIGLEIDELPVLARGFHYPLQPGMVIAIEPKFTFLGRGVVGIENSYAITENGFEKLTVTREGWIQL